MSSRFEIYQIIKGIEEKFPVNDWQSNKLHLWPLIRIRLYFFLIHTLESKKKAVTKKKEQTIKPTLIKHLKTFIKKKLLFNRYKKWLNSLEKKNKVFVGADSHRVDYRDSRFNKFFDVLVEKKSWENDYLYLEYASNSKLKFKEHNVNLFKPYLNYFLKNKILEEGNVSLNDYDDFLSHLTKDKRFTDFKTLFSEENLRKIASRLQIKIKFFKNVFKKISPEKVFILCYYSEDIMALTAAANQLGIETYEMQHGPQSDFHLAYGSWTSIPKKGYCLLPKVFWNWDNESALIINRWAIHSKFHSAEVVGNFWVDYWKNNLTPNKEKNIILYSLQCAPISLNDLFTDEIINCIKKDNHKWYIRLHPRHLHEIELIKDILKDKGVLNKVNIDEASQVPLPQLLKDTKLHITNSSGSVIEASYFNVKTIITGEIGLLYYQYLIDAGIAYYVNHSDSDFYEKYLEIHNKLLC
jgi:hypothetical protein